MPYAILQCDLAPLPAGKLRRAFRVLPRLRKIDADTMARDAFGILLSRLSHEDASSLQQALRSDGVNVEVVDEHSLAPLPQPKRLERAVCKRDALTVFDPLGREIVLDWSHVLLIAAGSVRLSQFKRVERDYIVYRGDARGGSMPIMLTDSSNKEERKSELIVEILLDIAPVRFRAMVPNLQYQYPGQGLRSNPPEKYVHFVRDLVTGAPEAILNRGAEAVQRQPPEPFEYPTKHAFEEEIVWLLWRSRLK